MLIVELNFQFKKLGGIPQHESMALTIGAAKNVINSAIPLGFEGLLELQIKSWAEIWKMADITIEGDVKAQQAIRFNIFQLNQTYLGKDPQLNIGPKGFTEKNMVEVRIGIQRPIASHSIWRLNILRFQKTY